jgi:hypothetical protein
MTRKIAWVGSKTRWIQDSDFDGSPLFDDGGNPVLTPDYEWEKDREIVITGVTCRQVGPDTLPGLSKWYSWGTAEEMPDNVSEHMKPVQREDGEEIQPYVPVMGDESSFATEMTDEDWDLLSAHETIGGFFVDVTHDPDWIQRYFRPMRELLRAP